MEEPSLIDLELEGWFSRPTPPSSQRTNASDSYTLNYAPPRSRSQSRAGSHSQSLPLTDSQPQSEPGSQAQSQASPPTSQVPSQQASQPSSGSQSQSLSQPPSSLTQQQRKSAARYQLADFERDAALLLAQALKDVLADKRLQVRIHPLPTTSCPN